MKSTIWRYFFKIWGAVYGKKLVVELVAGGGLYDTLNFIKGRNRNDKK